MWTIAQHTDPTSGAISWQVRLTDQPDVIVAGGMTSRGQAMTRVGELLAAALVAAPGDSPQGRRFEATFIEGEETRDGGGYARVIDPGATNFDRPMPLPIMATDTTSSWGHDGAVLVGAITEGSRTGDTVRLTGRFDVSERAAEFARLVDDGMLTRHSPDLGADTTEFDCTEYDEMYGWCEAGVLHFVDATLLGTTIVPFPALDSAEIVMVDENAPAAEPAEDVEDGMAAAAARPALVAAPTVTRLDPPFPADWFEDPALPAATPLSVDADGRIRGHIATWGTCHIGLPDACTTPPRSAAGYAHAHTSPPVELDNGTSLRVGHLTVGTGHAPTRGITAQAAAGHYDDSGFSAGLVRFGEDEHGIWAAGVVDPNATDEQIWALRVAAPSGDWRRIDGNLELVAVLAVNVPGFPIPDTIAASAAGECVALVAAGARGMVRLAEGRPQPEPPVALAAALELRQRIDDLEDRVGLVEVMGRALSPVAAEQLAGRLERTALRAAPPKPRQVALNRQPAIR